MQYGATSGDTPRPQPELKFTITPFFFATIAGTKWRMTFCTPRMFTSVSYSRNSFCKSLVA